MQVGSSLSRDYSLETVGEDDPSLGASALVVKGLVSFVSMGAPVEIRRSADSVPMRLFNVAPYARATFQGIKLHDGISRLGGAIHNQGELTLRNSVLEGNEARTFYEEPGLGGAVYNRNGSVQLDGATFRDNKADDGGGIYQIAEGISASVIATMGTQIRFMSTAITVHSVHELVQALAMAEERPALAWSITIDAGTDATWSSPGYAFDGTSFDGTYYTGFHIRGNVSIDAVSSPGFTFYSPPGGFSGPPTRLFSVEPGARLTLRSLRLLGGRTGLYSDGVNQGGVRGTCGPVMLKWQLLIAARCFSG